MSIIEAFNLAASISSILLAILAIFLSIWFFIQSKKSEQNTASSLTKIETQAESLQKINSKWMDRLTQYVTSSKPNPLESALPELFKIMSSIPQSLMTNLPQNINLHKDLDEEEILKELISGYIAIYFYSAQTNYWAQGYLPKFEHYQDNNELHILTKRMIDVSNTDFIFMQGVIKKIDRNMLTNNPLFHLLEETENLFKSNIRSVSDIFLEKKDET
jgi:hypothetical protein